MRLIGNREVEAALDMGQCIDLMRRTLAQMAQNGREQPLRTAFSLGEGRAIGIMPGSLDEAGVAGVKLLTVYKDNFLRGLPSHQGVVAVFDRETGALRALVDAEGITAVRTAAVSAAATDALARPDSETLCLLGAGTQARSHVRAIRLVRKIKRITVWDAYPDNALRFKRDMEAETGLPVELCGSGEEAVREADIVCTVTASAVPVLRGDWLRPGTHINAVGACGKEARELDTGLVAGSAFFVDSRISALNEAGDLLIPIAEGVLSAGHIRAEIGEVFCDMHPGRGGDEEITVFEAQGLAVEDIAAADFVWRACAKGDAHGNED